MQVNCLCSLVNFLKSFPSNRAASEEIVLADMHIKPGVAWEYCPREALRRVCKVLTDEFNLVRVSDHLLLTWKSYLCRIQVSNSALL